MTGALRRLGPVTASLAAICAGLLPALSTPASAGAAVAPVTAALPRLGLASANRAAPAPATAADGSLTIVAPTAIVRAKSDNGLFVSLHVRGTLPAVPPPGSTSDESPQPEYGLLVLVAPQGTAACDPATPRTNQFGMQTWEDGSPGSAFDEQVVPTSNGYLLGRPPPRGPVSVDVCAWLAPADPNATGDALLAPVAFAQRSFKMVAPSDALRVRSPRSVRAGHRFGVSVAATTTRAGEWLRLLVYRRVDLRRPVTACDAKFARMPVASPILPPDNYRSNRANVIGGRQFKRRVGVTVQARGAYRVCALLGLPLTPEVVRVASNALTVR